MVYFRLYFDKTQYYLGLCTVSSEVGDGESLSAMWEL